MIEIVFIAGLVFGVPGGFLAGLKAQQRKTPVVPVAIESGHHECFYSPWEDILLDDDNIVIGTKWLTALAKPQKPAQQRVCNYCNEREIRWVKPNFASGLHY